VFHQKWINKIQLQLSTGIEEKRGQMDPVNHFKGQLDLKRWW